MKIGEVVLGLATSHVPKRCRYVYTPMLSGLRWPGQTNMGSWPPAESSENKVKSMKPRTCKWTWNPTKLNKIEQQQFTWKTIRVEVLHLFRCFTHTHTQWPRIGAVVCKCSQTVNPWMSTDKKPDNLKSLPKHLPMPKLQDELELTLSSWPERFRQIATQTA